MVNLRKSASSLWERIGNVIKPIIDGSDLNMGSGDVIATEMTADTITALNTFVSGEAGEAGNEIQMWNYNGANQVIKIRNTSANPSAPSLDTGILQLLVDGTRQLTMSGDLTIEGNSIINQDLTTDANVNFNSIDIASGYFTVDANGNISGLTLNIGSGNATIDNDGKATLWKLDVGSGGAFAVDDIGNVNALGTIQSNSLIIANGGTIGSVSDPDVMTIDAGGNCTFSVFPITPIAAPDADYEVANKKYVDDSAGGGGIPGGANTQVQFNDSGTFGGDAGFTYNKTTDSITLAGFGDFETYLAVGGVETGQTISWDISATNILFYRMNDNTTSTVVTDTSGVGNNSTAWANTDTITTTGPFGDANDAFDFPGGTTDFLTVNTPVSEGLEWCISFWIKCGVQTPSGGSSTTPPLDSVIVGKSGDDNDFISVADGNGVLFEDTSGINAFWNDDTDFYNKWRWVCLNKTSGSVGGARIELWLGDLNGNLKYQGTNIISGSHDKLQITEIGYGFNNTNRVFTGQLSRLITSDDHLTISEIQSLFNNGSGVTQNTGTTNILASYFSPNATFQGQFGLSQKGDISTSGFVEAVNGFLFGKASQITESVNGIEIRRSDGATTDASLEIDFNDNVASVTFRISSTSGGANKFGFESDILLKDEINLRFGSSGADAFMRWDTSGNDFLALFLTLGTSSSSGNFVIANTAHHYRAWNFPTRTFPTLCIFSDENPQTDDDQYFRFWHNRVDGNIEAITGGINFIPASGSNITIGDGGTAKLVLPKSSSAGIQVDTTTPTFGFADIIGDQFSKNTGATKPALVSYNGVINSWQFGVGDEAYMSFHIPHDYVAGSPIFLHIHWSHIATTVTGGTVTFKATSIYTKAHNQAPFQSVPAEGTFTGTASTTQYQQILSEVLYSDGTPTGIEIDTDDLEPDGVIEMTFELDVNNITVSSGGVPDPFIHFVDIHYQTTGLIGTKDKAPDFYN